MLIPSIIKVLPILNITDIILKRQAARLYSWLVIPIFVFLLLHLPVLARLDVTTENHVRVDISSRYVSTGLGTGVWATTSNHPAPGGATLFSKEGILWASFRIGHIIIGCSGIC